MMSLIWKLFVTAAVAFTATTAALYLMQDRLIFPAPNVAAPVQLDDGLELVRIETEDGERLVGLFRQPEPGRATVLMFHGNGDFIDNTRPIARHLADAGYGVLAVEYRGYPGSSGSPSEAGLRLDAQAAYAFVEDKTEGPIAVFGHSLGSGVAVTLTSERPVQALMLASPFDSLLSVARSRMPWLPVATLLRHPFRSDLKIGGIDAPILIIHGDRDGVVPIEQGRTLAQRAGEAATFETIEGAGHNNLAAFGLGQRLVDFLDNVAGSRAG